MDNLTSTVLLSTYNTTATHNGCLLALGHIVCWLYLLSIRARTEQIKRLRNNVTYTVQAVLTLTLPQCLFYLFIAIFVRSDFPIRIGTCSFFKHFASYSSQISYLVPSCIAFCRYLHLVWIFNLDRIHISLIIALMAFPQIGLATAFTFFGIPVPNDTCAQLNVYQSPSVTTTTQYYLLIMQPLGITLQLYNRFYLRRIMKKQKGDGKNAPRTHSKLFSKYIDDYRATHAMIGHLIVILIAISLKFSFVLITKFTYIQSGALLKIIDIIPYTMPGWIGLISILCISDNPTILSSLFRCRAFTSRRRVRSATSLTM